MKTNLIFSALLLSGLMISTSTFSKGKVTIAKFDSSHQIELALHKGMEFKKEMNDTKATVFFKVNENREIDVVKAIYPDKEIAKEIEKIVRSYAEKNTPVKKGYYQIDLFFQVY